LYQGGRDDSFVGVLNRTICGVVPPLVDGILEAIVFLSGPFAEKLLKSNWLYSLCSDNFVEV